MSELLIANVTAAVLLLLALARSVYHRRGQSEEERAILVLLVGMVVLSLTGLIRRMGYDHVDLVATVAWTIIAAAALWVTTKAVAR